MPEFIKKIFNISQCDKTAEKLHKANVKEMEKTTRKIKKLNKLLVKKSVAYKIHLASGHDKV